MKSISAKLFLAILGLTSLMLVATLLLARWSFDQGFLDYVNSQQQRHMSRMAEDLSEHYVENGYQWNEASDQAFMAAFHKWYPRPGGRGRKKHGPSFRSSFNESDFFEGASPLPRSDRNHTNRINDDHKRDGFGSKKKDKRGGRDGRRFPHELIVLFDIDGTPISGDAKLLEGSDTLTVDIMLENKQMG